MLFVQRWLAPEVMRGQRATPAADVFSFAVVSHTAPVVCAVQACCQAMLLGVWTRLSLQSVDPCLAALPMECPNAACHLQVMWELLTWNVPWSSVLHATMHPLQAGSTSQLLLHSIACCTSQSYKAHTCCP
jgi:hypothetical protein